MENKVQCQGCQAVFRVTEKHAGKTVKCPKCGSPIAIAPVATNTAATSAPAGTASAPKMVPVAKAIPSVSPIVTGPVMVPSPVMVPVSESLGPQIPMPRIVLPGSQPEFQPGYQTDFQVPQAAVQQLAATHHAASQWESTASTTSNAAPDASPQSDAAPAAGFTIQTAGPANNPKASPTDRLRGRPAKKVSTQQMLIAGGIALGALIGIVTAVVFVMSTGSKPPVAKKNTTPANPNGNNSVPSTTPVPAPPAVPMARVAIDLPANIRKDVKLTIDGSPREIPRGGVVEFQLPPGEHTIALERRGYYPIESKVTATLDRPGSVIPTWKKDPVADLPPALANLPATFLAADVQTDRYSTVEGFSGWMQNFANARRLAAARKKPILAVFSISDKGEKTKSMVRDVFDQQSFRDYAGAKFIPVVIDLPQTNTAYSHLEDRAQNSAMWREHQISPRDEPTILLFNSDGKPFARNEGEIAGGVAAAIAQCDKMAGDEATFNDLWTKVRDADEASRLEHVVKLLDWVSTRDLIGGVRDEIKQWLPIAEKADPDNAKKQYEVVFAPYWTLEMIDKSGNEFDRKDLLEMLEKWTSTRNFSDPNRAVRLYFTAALLLGREGLNDEAVELLNKAASYEPTDPQLKEAAIAAKRMAKGSNILSSGTGFVITAEGHMLTNHHVIEGEGKTNVRLMTVPAGNTTGEPTELLLPATVIKSDPRRDIAVVKFDPPAGLQLKPVPVAEGKIARGMRVACFGYPVVGLSAGGQLKLTTGVVSSPPAADNDQMVLLDARVNPGNSGGPLCDSRGNVIGMVTAKSRRINENVETYGLAVPEADLVKFIQQAIPDSKLAPASELSEQPDFAKIDELISPSVLMIVKTK